MDLPTRKTTRLKDYDYSTPGAYFITFCTRGRKEILSRIVGTGVPDGPQNTQNILTDYGKIAEKHIIQMATFYDNISIDNYVIMPNHIHLLLQIHYMDIKNGPPRTSVPTNSAISQFVSTLKRFCNKECGENIWQSRSNDHIIRNEYDYKNIYEYIETNVIRWDKDCFYPQK